MYSATSAIHFACIQLYCFHEESITLWKIKFFEVLFFPLIPMAFSPPILHFPTCLSFPCLSVFRLRRKKVVLSVNPPSTEDASSTDNRYSIVHVPSCPHSQFSTFLSHFFISILKRLFYYRHSIGS